MDHATFWQNVDRKGPDECWLWLGSRNEQGYGYAKVGPRQWKPAHRVAFEIAHGHPPNHLACHHCDIPSCCNPAHLFDGTHQDNTDDRKAKGRTRTGGRGPVLTQQKADRIRTLYATGTRTQRQLGKRFGVSTTAISFVIQGRTWKT